MLGTKYVKNKVPSLYAEKRACSTSFHGNFFCGGKRAWAFE